MVSIIILQSSIETNERDNANYSMLITLVSISIFATKILLEIQ